MSNGEQPAESSQLDEAGGTRRPYRRRLMLNMVSTAAGSGWAIIVALVSIPLLVHGLGPVGFGIWALLQTFSAVNGWFSIADLGMSTAVVHAIATRAGAGNEAGAAGVATTSVLLYSALGMAAGLAMLALGPTVLLGRFHIDSAHRAAAHLAFAVFGIQVFGELLIEGFEACLEGLQRVDVSRLLDGLRRTLVIGTAVVTAQVADLGSVVVASAIATFGAVILGFALLRHHLPGRRFEHPDAGALRPLIHYARSAVLVDVNGVVKRAMDRSIVGLIVGPLGVGLVEIATQLQNGASALLGASSYSAVSSSAWLEGRGDHESLRVLLERGTRYSLLVTWPIALCTAFLADAAIHLWLGSRYIEAAGLTALALVPLVGAPLQVGSNMLRGTGRVRDIVRPAFVSTMVNLVASVAFVYRYGVVGAFLGTIIATLILVPYLGRSVFRAFSVEPWRFCQRAVAPVLIPTLALTLVLTIVVVADLSPAATLVIGGIAGLGAYVPLAFFVAVPRAERLEIRELLRRPSSSREDARDWPHTLAG